MSHLICVLNFASKNDKSASWLIFPSYKFIKIKSIAEKMVPAPINFKKEYFKKKKVIGPSIKEHIESSGLRIV